MDLRQLEYVTAIADTGSFTRGAERCQVAQSALSRRVAQLESELGARLFDRNNREVRRTGAGSAFVPAARRVLAEAARARAEVDDLAGVRRGHVRIGTTQTASRCLGLAALLGGFRRRFPEVTIAVTSGPRQELLDALAAAELDLVLASDGTAAGDGVAVTELLPRLDIAFESAGVVRAVAFELGQLTEMISFAAAGLGTAIVPRAFTTELAASVRDSVRVLRLADPSLALTVCAYTRPASWPPAARALAGHIIAVQAGDGGGQAGDGAGS